MSELGLSRKYLAKASAESTSVCTSLVKASHLSVLTTSMPSVEGKRKAPDRPPCSPPTPSVKERLSSKVLAETPLAARTRWKPCGLRAAKRTAGVGMESAQRRLHPSHCRRSSDWNSESRRAHAQKASSGSP
eukprot:3378975-Pleurochrysis_carterae.AAC.2